MYGYPEFPNTKMHDYDMQELIDMYKKLVKEYSGLLNNISTLKEDLSEYEQYVTNSIGPLVANANTQYLSKLTTIEYNVRSNYTQLLSLITQEKLDRQKADDNLMKEINHLRAVLCKWQNEYKSTLEQLSQQWDTMLLEQKLFLMGRDAYYYNKVLETLHDLQNQINSIPEDTKPVRNPIRDTVTTVNDAIEDLWEYAFPILGFTVEEFDRSSYITCEYFKRKNVSVLDWYIKGKMALDYYYFVNHVFSPVTGEYVTMQTALYQLANEIRRGIIVGTSGLTAEEYDSKKLMAESYDAKELKGYCYDWKGKELLKDAQLTD